MCNTTKEQVRALAISLLTNENGISFESYTQLRDLLFAFGVHGIVRQVEATDDCYYLPEDWEDYSDVEE